MKSAGSGRRGRRLLITLVIVLIASEIPFIRVWLTAPLVVQSEFPDADAAYVLMGGAALRERLSAAADLVLMHRVPRIFLIQDKNKAAFNFKAKTNWTPTEWAVDYLKWQGVAAEAIQILEDRETSKMGTLDEAQSVAAQLPSTVNRLVLVTSPAHTRRSVLAFKRNLPSRVTVFAYPATGVRQSVEFYHPLSVEYFKFLLYAVLA